MEVTFEPPAKTGLEHVMDQWKHLISDGRNPCADVDLSSYKRNLAVFKIPKGKHWNKRKIKKMIKSGRIKAQVFRNAYPAHMSQPDMTTDCSSRNTVTLAVTLNFSDLEERVYAEIARLT